MPIQGLTERRRLPRLGKIHLGIKKIKTVNGKDVEYPSAVDYFVCPEAVQVVFGEKPKELRILIPVEDEERWASQYYRGYAKTRGLICKGDGINAVRMVDTETGALADSKSKDIIMKDIPCQGRECPEYNKQCREVMNLQFLLPEVAGLGIWQIDTGSINSIRNINSASELIKRIYGRISMIPLLLTIEPYSVQDPDGKKRDVYVLNLRTNQTLLELMETASAKRLTAGEAEPAMPEPDDELPDLIMPQNQEPVVTREALEENGKLQEESASLAMTKQPESGKIDMDWLKESLEEMKWKNVSKWLREHYPEAKGTTVKAIVESLTREHQEAFVNEVQIRLEIYRISQQ